MTVDYVVEFGNCGYLARCQVSPGETYRRGDRVIICSPRGIEPAVILGPVDARLTILSHLQSSSQILRRWRETDQGDSREFLQRVLMKAESLAAELRQPVIFIDAEGLLEGGPIILHLLPTGPFQIDPLLQSLQLEFGRAFLIQSLNSSSGLTAAPSSRDGGCGKSGCGSQTGSGGCSGCGTNSESGCSAGGCSRHQYRSGAELTDDFRALRQQLQQHSSRRRTNLC
jgi:hypothetical protein